MAKNLEKGKRRGYDEIRQVDSVDFIFQYAIKKEDGVFQTHFFSVDESRLDVFEDYAHEEIRKFPCLEDALEYLISKGAEIERMTAIKRVLPF